MWDKILIKNLFIFPAESAVTPICLLRNLPQLLHWWPVSKFSSYSLNATTKKAYEAAHPTSNQQDDWWMVFVIRSKSSIRVSASVYQVLRISLEKLGLDLAAKGLSWIQGQKKDSTQHHDHIYQYWTWDHPSKIWFDLGSEKSKEHIILLTTILTIARGMSGIQAVRMESQATFLNDQDTLHIPLTESGVGDHLHPWVMQKH